LGETYLAAANPEAAVDVLARAVVLNPLEVEIRIALARAWYQTGAFETALTWLERFAGLGHARLELLRGQVYYDSRRYQDAKEAFGLALRADPDLDDARIHRAATVRPQRSRTWMRC
jgi:tetratricopeptide (TPR) repeat protein